MPSNRTTTSVPKRSGNQPPGHRKPDCRCCIDGVSGCGFRAFGLWFRLITIEHNRNKIKKQYVHNVIRKSQYAKVLEILFEPSIDSSIRVIVTARSPHHGYRTVFGVRVAGVRYSFRSLRCPQIYQTRHHVVKLQ